MRDKGQEAVLHVAHVLLAMVYPPALREGITIVARDAMISLDITEDGESLGLLVG